MIYSKIKNKIKGIVFFTFIYFTHLRNNIVLNKVKAMGKRPNTCTKDQSFEECELEILHEAIAKAEVKKQQTATNMPEINKIMAIVEDFIRKKKLIVYGGTAQNNILPKKDQFYDTNVDIPDYDFFSPNAKQDVKELADIYAKAGYIEVDAKSGMHSGTYKLFVNFIPTADITQMPQSIFNTLKRDALKINGIIYSPPNFLRMGMYLELSRPDGDVSRWEKVYKRLVLINKHYPLTSKECSHVDFQRPMSMSLDKHASANKPLTNKDKKKKENKKEKHSDKSLTKEKGTKISNEEIYDEVLKTFIHQDVVFFGGYAISKYAQYMPHHVRSQLQKIPDFDVLSEDALKTADIVKERLEDIGCKDVSVHKFADIGEIVSGHYEIRVGKDTVAFIYQPNACHSYNVLKDDGKDGNSVRIATIDTMLSYYLAFLYADKYYYDVNRIVCMSKYLFDVQAKNRLSQKGLLKRFSINCIGHQETVEEIREHKSEMWKKLSKSPGSKEYEEMFYRYRPDQGKGRVKRSQSQATRTKKKSGKPNLNKNKSKKKRAHLTKRINTRKRHRKKYKKYQGKTRKKSKNKTKKYNKNLFRIF